MFAHRHATVTVVGVVAPRWSAAVAVGTLAPFLAASFYDEVLAS